MQPQQPPWPRTFSDPITIKLGPPHTTAAPVASCQVCRWNSDPTDRLWIATQQGTFHYEGGELVKIEHADGRVAEFPRVIKARL
jgi:hypothetical protein